MSRRSINSRYERLHGSGVKETLTSILNPLGLIQNPPDYPNEAHVRNYNFLGPGTDLISRRIDKDLPSKPYEPINKLDAAAKKHDLAYEAINKKKNTVPKEELLKEAHDADDEFINELKKIPNFNLTAIAASKAILLKKYLEQKGFLSPEAFSLSGTGMNLHQMGAEMLGLYQNPAHKLIKKYNLTQMNEKQKKNKKKMISGGLAPFVLPFLIPVLSSLAVKGIDYLFNRFSKKQNGEGVAGYTKKKDLIKASGISQEDKIKFIVSKLDDMPHEKQLNEVIMAVKYENKI